MKDMKQIFLLGLVVGMILGAIIIIFSLFVGNSTLGFDKFWTQSDYAPYFKNKSKSLFSDGINQYPYRIKKINRNGLDFVYLLEGVKDKPFQKRQIHPNRKPAIVAPM